MSKKLFGKADEESIDIVDRAIGDLRKLGATLVDPGPEGELFKGCLIRYAPELLNSAFARQYPDLFPASADQTSTLLDLRANPTQIPANFGLRTLAGAGIEGEAKYMMNRYLRDRGDANIKTNADLVTKAKFYQDPNFPDRKQQREASERATRVDSAARLQTRFALQNLLLQCMQEQRLDALVSPMSTVPPRKLTSPREPNASGRAPIGYSLIGQQGFPVITVPAGFTTQVWDRERDSSTSTRLVGPVQASLPVGVDFIARPFEEATLFRISSAYESATHHRKPPPEFGPLPGEP